MTPFIARRVALRQRRKRAVERRRLRIAELQAGRSMPEPVYISNENEPPAPPPEPELRVSNINPAFPVFGTPTTASVRGNFAAARTEIEQLQDGKLNLSGGTMTGQITLTDDQLIDGGTFGTP